MILKVRCNASLNGSNNFFPGNAGNGVSIVDQLPKLQPVFTEE